jgi:hypothetical protein
MATLKNTTINDTGYFTLPNGTTAERPISPANGMIRVNTTTNVLEGYIAGTWITIAASVGTQNNPATSASQIRTYNPSATDGDYWYTAGGSTIQCYTNFSSAPSGKGYVQVARGRESTDWWNNAGQNTSGLTQSGLSTNTPIAVSPQSFVSGLSGGNWNSMKMLVNRMNIPDSLYIQGTTSTTFSWAFFNSDPSSVNATITRYTSNWKGGSVSYTGTNISQWTDTLSAGLASNDCTRTFTWTWSGHGGYQGWSGGSSCTPAGSFQVGGEGHAIELVNVYIEC